MAEHSAYHHGEVSLQSTIVGLAQNFVGSNNINLLLPNGQFGTRNMGGKDHASARYIFTALSPVTRHLFPEEDDNVLSFLEEEGQSIEPTHYLPILPLCLVNGADGIGTGWSTSIPQYDPRVLAANLRRMMRGEEPQPMEPWYKGWAGTLVRAEKGFTMTGTWSRDVDDKGEETELEITDLPVGKWTRDYKTFLEEQLCGVKEGKGEDLVDSMSEHHAENRVHFRLSVPKLPKLSEEVLIKKFKLQSSISTANLVLFDAEGKIQRYQDELHILKDYYKVRENLYV